jgi:hypothetical protein
MSGKSSHDYYRILGIASTADATTVKRAYRTRAKAVHPDAGGSTESMEQLGEAYRVLSDPEARRDYDRAHGERETMHRPEPPRRPAQRPEPSRRANPEPADPYQEIRLAQARWSAWGILKSATVAAVLINIITRFLAAQASLAGFRVKLALVGYVPVYAMAVGIIFLINPELRLALHDLSHNLRSRRHRRVHIPGSDLQGLLILAIATVPLALLWVAFFA